MPQHIRRVAVIGAGPAGAIATDALVKEEAFDTIRVFDRRIVVGGTWVYTPHLPPKVPSLDALVSGEADKRVPIPEYLPAVTPFNERVNSHQQRYSDTPIHENLHSNIAPEIMGYTEEPLPNKLSQQTLKEYGPGAPFRHHTVVRQWVEDLFIRGDHDKLLELRTTVELVVKEGDEWVITLRKVVNGSNYWWKERFDAVVVASGHYNIPWFPVVQGFLDYNQRFPGKILHSKHFRGGQHYRGKRIIVVGASVSAIEVMYEILDFIDGPLYASVRDEPLEYYGWVPLEHPKISVKPAIDRMDPRTGRVWFTDGSFLDDVDHIIYGTGYTFSFPFLPGVQERVKKAHRRLPGVYQHTWDIEDPTLTFVGMIGSFTFKAYEWQAVAVARFLAGRSQPLPLIEDQREWERQRVAERRGGKAYYSIGPDYESFFEWFREFAGDPVRGTTGRVLPPFEPRWLAIWGSMFLPKLDRWRWKKKEAEWKQEFKAKLSRI